MNEDKEGTGKVLQGKELEEANDLLSEVPAALCDGMLVSMAALDFDDGSSEDALILTMSLAGNAGLASFAFKPEGIAAMIEGLQSALVAWRQKHGMKDN